MAQGKRRWLWVILILILVIAIIAIILFQKKKKVSLGLAEQIPSTTWMGQINLWNVLNSSYPDIEFDAEGDAKRFDRRRWDELLQNPMKLGVDLFSNPWIYGNDSAICLLLQLADTQKFATWLRQDVEEIKSLKWSSNELCNSVYVVHDHLEIAWDGTGKMLAVISLHKQQTDEVYRYFENEESRDLSNWKIGNSAVKFRVFKENISASLQKYQAWLSADEYKISFSKSEIVINEELWNVGATDPLDISLTNGAISQKQFWNHKVVDAMMGSRIGVGQVADDRIPELKLLYRGVDSAYHYHSSFVYDDNFNKIEVKDSSLFYQPDWQFVMRYDDQKGFEKVPSASSTGEGMLLLSVEHENNRISCWGASKPLSKTHGPAGSYAYVEYQPLADLLTKLQIESDIKKFSFIQDLQYQATDSNFYLRVGF